MSDEEYGDNEIDEAERAERLVALVIERCEEAEIEYEDFCHREDFGVTDVNLNVYLPSGRKKRDISLWDTDDLEQLLSVEFEKYTILGNYAAVCRYDTGEIEAAIGLLDETPMVRRIIPRILVSRLGLVLDENSNLEPKRLKADIGGVEVELTLCPIGSELQVLTGLPRSVPIGLKIHHPKFSTHADALRILEKFSHSLFFQIEAEVGLGLTLMRKRGKRTTFLHRGKEAELAFPKYEYDEGPMSLYWYARSARNMPLLQFLAFYQAIEFYFPAYFNAEVSRRIRTIIKDPSFRVDRDAHLAKIINVTRPGKGAGSERDQLRATLRECVDEQDVVEFLKEDKDRQEFFGSKQKGITDKILNQKNKGEPLVQQVADRIYEIRCKVVHVKGDEGDAEVELLLPYTEEAEKLEHDIQLVRMLASKVLIASSSPLRSS